MTVMWVLIAIKAVLCAAVALPTFFFLRGGGWLTATYRRRVQRRLERALARLAGDFQADESFLASGVGLAADFAHRRFFVAEHDGGRTRAAVLPFAALTGVSSGEMNQNGFYNLYVELAVDDPKRPLWRLLLGENEELAGAVRALLGRLNAPAAARRIPDTERSPS